MCDTYGLSFERLAFRALDMLDDQEYIDCVRPVVMNALPKDMDEVIETTLDITVDLSLDDMSDEDPIRLFVSELRCCLEPVLMLKMIGETSYMDDYLKDAARSMKLFNAPSDWFKELLDHLSDDLTDCIRKGDAEKWWDIPSESYSDIYERNKEEIDDFIEMCESDENL